MRAKVRKSKVRLRVDLTLEDIARWFNPILRGWINYYGHYHLKELGSVMSHFNGTLVNWANRKYGKYRFGKKKAIKLIKLVAKINPNLFAHWEKRMTYMFV